MEWRAGVFEIATREGVYRRGGEISGLWGIHAVDDLEEARPVWRLTHLPSGRFLAETVSLDDAKEIAEAMMRAGSEEQWRRINADASEEKAALRKRIGEEMPARLAHFLRESTDPAVYRPDLVHHLNKGSLS